jgi:hypothetical protein
MPEINKRFQSNSREVAAKVMDGEAIFINLSTGVYYSMNEVGTLIWELIETGRTPEEALEIVTGRYEVSREQAKADVERLVSVLLEENIVIQSDNEAKPGQPVGIEKGLAERKPYVVPELLIYRDMGDLLALDPPMPGLQDIPWKGRDGE